MAAARGRCLKMGSRMRAKSVASWVTGCEGPPPPPVPSRHNALRSAVLLHNGEDLYDHKNHLYRVRSNVFKPRGESTFGRFHMHQERLTGQGVGASSGEARSLSGLPCQRCERVIPCAGCQIDALEIDILKGTPVDVDEVSEVVRRRCHVLQSDAPQRGELGWLLRFGPIAWMSVAVGQSRSAPGITWVTVLRQSERQSCFLASPAEAQRCEIGLKQAHIILENLVVVRSTRIRS